MTTLVIGPPCATLTTRSKSRLWQAGAWDTNSGVWRCRARLVGYGSVFLLSWMRCGDAMRRSIAVCLSQRRHVRSPHIAMSRLQAPASVRTSHPPHRHRRNGRGYNENVRGEEAPYIDEYLAGCRRENRVALQKVRRAVRAAAPRAEEGISTGCPLPVTGSSLLLSKPPPTTVFHPMSGDTVATLKADLADTIRARNRSIPARAGLPATLFRSWSRRALRGMNCRSSRPRL